MKHASALATLRELVELNLHGRAILPELNATMREVVGYDSVCFSWTDQSYSIIDTQFLSGGELEAAAYRYFQEYHNKREKECIRSLKDLMLSGCHYDASDHYGRSYFNSSLYSEVNRPAGMHHFMRLPVMDGMRPVGCLAIGRAQCARSFSDKEKEFVRQASGLISHLLSKSSAPFPAGEEESGERGTLICDMRGNVEYFDAAARRLLCQATHTSHYHALSDESFRWAKPLMQLIWHVRNPSVEYGAPFVSVHNESGLYQLRGYPLYKSILSASDRINVQISRLIPRRLMWLHSPLLRALPAKEKRVCVLLLEGMPVKDIAQTQGISYDGVTYHLRNIYARLGVSHRDELYPLVVRSIRSPEKHYKSV